MGGPVLNVFHPAGYTPERTYAARVVLRDLLGLDCRTSEQPVDCWQISLDGYLLELPDILFRTPESGWLTAESLPGPELYGEDVFGSVFFLLTRYEELVVRVRDEHDRFPPEASLVDLDRPLADELADGLWEAMQAVWPRLERREAARRLVPSHDVDTPWSVARLRTAAGELRRGHPWLALRRAGALVGLDPVATLDRLMAASERRGLRATFFFLVDGAGSAAGKAGGVRPYGGAPYSLDEPRVRRLLRHVHERGHEIGLHPGYDTFRDPAKIDAEFDRLVRVCTQEGIEQDVWGARQHFLRWENPITWRAYEQAGLDYDSSLGYSSRPGFRAGTCREYAVFDLEARRELTLRERPLILMDTPTLDRLGLPDEELIAHIDLLRARCSSDFTVLWHNHWLVTRRQKRLLEAALGPADD